MHFGVQLLFITPAPINQSGRAHTTALPYTGMTSQNIFIGGMHLAEKSAQCLQFDFIEAQTRQVTISYLPYTGLTAPRNTGNQFENIEVAQLLQITTFSTSGEKLN